MHVSLPAGTTVTSVREGGEFTQVTAGYATGYALTKTGVVYAWGLGPVGGLGNGSKPESVSSPVRVKLPSGDPATWAASGPAGCGAFAEIK